MSVRKKPTPSGSTSRIVEKRMDVQRGVLILSLVAALAGCGPGGKTCPRCETVVVQRAEDEHARLVKGRCRLKGGVEIDCAVEHDLCPQCREKE